MLNPNLPEEILIEIFSLLPAKSVGRCRCLSKSWRTHLSTSQFINSHLTHKTNREDVIVILRGESVYPISTPLDADKDALVSQKLDLPEDLMFDQVLGSCNGLVFYLTFEGEIFAVNPLTLQQVLIEASPLSDYPYKPVITFGFGYDNISDDYKILKVSRYNRISDPRSLDGPMAEVYSLKNKFWKRLDNLDFYFEPRGRVFLNGSIHWMSENEDGACVIAAFDVATESFHAIPAPSDNLREWYSCALLENRGCLFIIPRYIPSYEGWKDAWVMKEYGQENSWTKCPTLTHENKYSPHFYIPHPVCAIGDDEIVILSYSGSLIVWKLADGTTKDVTVNGSHEEELYMRTMCTFVYSLVSPIQYDVAS